MHSIKILTGVVVTGNTRATWKCPVGGDARRPRPQTDNSDAAQPRDDGTVNKGPWHKGTLTSHSSQLENAIMSKNNKTNKFETGKLLELSVNKFC